MLFPSVPLLFLSFSSFVSLSCQLFTFLFHLSFYLHLISFIAVLLLFPFPFISFPFPFLSYVLFTLLTSFFISYNPSSFSFFYFLSFFLLVSFTFHLFPLSSFLLIWFYVPFLSCVMFTLLTPSLSHVNPFLFTIPCFPLHSCLFLSSAFLFSSFPLLSFPFFSWPLIFCPIETQPDQI